MIYGIYIIIYVYMLTMTVILSYIKCSSNGLFIYYKLYKWNIYTRGHVFVDRCIESGGDNKEKIYCSDICL